MKLTWINFLHLYQPAAIDDEKVIEATEKSYTRIISALQRNPEIKFTLNITGCLVEKWDQLGYSKLISDITELIKNGQIELTGSAAYHAFLPILPENEVIRRVKMNEEILRKYFGITKPKGFFIPEAAYGRRLAKIIKKLGYDWLILDEITAFGALNKISREKLYIDKNSELKLCFRSRKYSLNYVPQIIAAKLKKDSGGIVITATDAELYGLRHEDFSANFEKILKSRRLRTATISEYLKSLKEKIIINPMPSSWESTEKELKNSQPYHLWLDKKNKIHIKLWELALLAIKTVNKHPDDKNYGWARRHLDRGLASCTFWWASAKDFKLFGPISWSPDEIERGVNEIIRSIRALDDPATRKTKIQAEKLYIEIKRMIWQRHWHYYWKK